MNCCLVPAYEGYELWAQTYDADPNPLLHLEERALGPLLSSLANKTVLDVACGTGRWLEKALVAGARSGAGVDTSPGMLGVGRTRPLLQRRLVMGDCLALPFPSEIADLVICSFVIGHIGNLEAFARELARVARRPSDVYVSDVHPEASAKGWRTGFRHKTGNVHIATVTHSLREIEWAFRSAGFEVSRRLEPCLGEPERPIFEQSGKDHMFRSACETPAVYVCHFKRRGVVKVPQHVSLGNAP